MKSIVERLKSILEREPAMQGEALSRAVEEKERLIGELENGLRLSEPGADKRAADLQSVLAPLIFANGLSLKFNRIRLQHSRLRKPEAAPVKRLDLIS